MDKNQIKAFLDRISLIESSGGKDFSHREMTSGLHKGTSAIGRFGLMPKTVDEIISRSKQQNKLTPQLKALSKLDPEKKKELLEKNPDLEYQLAEQLASHVLSKQQGDEEKAAYSWLYGHNLTPDKIQKRGYMEDPYVQKYKKLKPEQETPMVPVSSNSFINDTDKQALANYLQNIDPVAHEKQKNEMFAQASREAKDHPIIESLMSGGIGAGPLVSAARTASKPFVQQGFSKLSQLLGKKSVDPLMKADDQAAWVARQIETNPAVKEVLEPGYQYAAPQSGEALAETLKSSGKFDELADLIRSGEEVTQIIKRK